MNEKIIFMGTPIFATHILKRLIKEGYDVIAVVTQPDKPVGRKRELLPTPVKQVALEHNIQVLQPNKIREEYQEILDLNADLIITCAYGQIVPKVLLDGPRLGCINIHASLLPKNRGGAPIHKAIMYGEKESGISIMRMAVKMDAGDVCSVSKVIIEDTDTMGDLHDKLAQSGSDLIIDTLPSILNETAVFEKQDESLVTYSYNVSKEEEFVCFNKSYQEIYDHIRALIPYPVAYGLVEDRKIKFHKIRKSNETSNKENGTILGLVDNAMAIAVDQKVLLIDQLQVEGKSKMSAVDFFNGQGKAYIQKVFKNEC